MALVVRGNGDASKVPATRKINGKTLDTDITLSASDVGALENTYKSTLIVNVTPTGNADDSATADKTYAEVLEAYNNGKSIACLVQNSFLVPLAAAPSNTGQFQFVLTGIIGTGTEKSGKTLYITCSEDGWSLVSGEFTIPTQTSDLFNDSGFLTSAPVTKVNNKTGAVTLTASDVGALPATGGTISGELNVDAAINTSEIHCSTAELALTKSNPDTGSGSHLVLQTREGFDASDKSIPLELALFAKNYPVVEDVDSYQYLLNDIKSVDFDLRGLLATKGYVDDKTPFILTCDKDNTGEVVFDKTVDEFNEAINQNKPIVLYDPYGRIGNPDSFLYHHGGGYYFYYTNISIEQDRFRDTKAVKMYLSWVFLSDSNGTITLDERAEIGSRGTHEYWLVEKPASLLTFKNVSVPTSAWTSDSTYAAFSYRAAIACANVTANHIPDVIFDVVDAMSGNFAPVVSSYDGGVYIYATSKPTAAITIPTIEARCNQW